MGTLENKENSSEKALKFLSDVQGITIEDGVTYCGNPELFIKFLTNFKKSIDFKAGEIEEALNTGNIEFYTIKVHAVKSVARIFGATKLADTALSLEMAGKEGNREYISANTPEFLKLYRSYNERLSVLDEIGEMAAEKKPLIGDLELKDAYMALKELIAAMDYDGAEDVLLELDGYELPKEAQSDIEKLGNMLKMFDWDGMEQLIKEK
ncbi:MAG: Hpt domain-containing protein [Butyrivibrio sp.]|nr:Hpt domain-containing protein [Butyrivibrio sp.]